MRPVLGEHISLEVCYASRVMPGLIDASIAQIPSAAAADAVGRFSELLASAGIAMRVRREGRSTAGPAIRFEVRELGSLSHLHIVALERIVSRTGPFGGIAVVVNRGRTCFLLPAEAEACIQWFRDDRGSSDAGLIARLWGRLRGS